MNENSENPTQKKKREIKDPVKHYGEQSIRQDFVPISESDLAGAVDVPIIEKRVESVEKQGKILPFKKSKEKSKTKVKSKAKKSSKKETKIKISKPIKLDSNGPILIITEKPQAAQKIAFALAESKVDTKKSENVSYYYFLRGDREINVVCAVGHLFTLAQVNKRNPWPTFDIHWVPNFQVRKKDFTKKYYDVILKMAKRASEIVVATDYDIEGEVIGMNIVKYICNQKDADRMKFSTLTGEEIKKSYEERSKTLDWKQGIAGETRHYLDWIYGINLSRALMDAIKSTGKFRLMSIGRVQGPALNIIVKKEREINAFKSTKYWDIYLDVSDNKNLVRVKHNKDITKEPELSKFRNLKDKEGIAETKKSQQKIPPLSPFDLTSLQIESYKFYKITPSRTLEIAQRLYLAGVISYPRTSSQKIPKEIGYDKILKRLSERFDFIKYAKRKEPIEGKKTDPAHPSIFPTGEFHQLEDEDFKIYSLIVKRFVSCFCEEAIVDNKKINVTVDNLLFTASGLGIAEKGWMNVYPSNLVEKELPDLNGKVLIKKVDIEEKYTQPPHRYSPASLLTELEKKNLGTKATRANILETLYDRNYIKEKSIQATSLGISLIDSLEKYCPIIIDEKLTRDVEKHLESIRNSKDLNKKQQEVLTEVKQIIYSIGKEFSKNKENIGKSLFEATTQLWEDQKKENELMPCDVCKKGNLTIKYSKKSMRYFVACTNYPECTNTYSLPPNSLIKKTDKTCEFCNFPMLISIKKAKRPWIFCFNPQCPSRKAREEAKAKQEADNNSNNDSEENNS
ncbi:MAG: DNA topoisomerase I [Nanoarchaeota archaeon]|mgnify:CR=1 FL=1